jgi:hypothetical protein
MEPEENAAKPGEETRADNAGQCAKDSTVKAGRCVCAAPNPLGGLLKHEGRQLILLCKYLRIQTNC